MAEFVRWPENGTWMRLRPTEKFAGNGYTFSADDRFVLGVVQQGPIGIAISFLGGTRKNARLTRAKTA
jgi:hypothetical protein